MTETKFARYYNGVAIHSSKRAELGTCVDLKEPFWSWCKYNSLCLFAIAGSSSLIENGVLAEPQIKN